MINFGELLNGPVYSVFGGSCTLTPLSGSPVAVNVIDKSSGIEVGLDDMTGGVSMRPAAIILVSELARVGLARDALRRATLVMNGKTWRIESTLPRPAPNGEAAGELLLFLIEV